MIVFDAEEWQATEYDDDRDEDQLAAQDYAWFVARGAFAHSDGAWLDFRDGYRSGGEIGRRRYAARSRRRRHAMPLPVRADRSEFWEVR